MSDPFGRWPPALPPVDNMAVPNTSGSFMKRIVNGATETIVPQAPPGHCYLLRTVCAANEDPALTADFTFDEGGALRDSQRLLAANTSSQRTGSLATTLPLTCTVGGLGGPLVVSGGYSIFPLTQLQPWAVILTNVFQSIPLAIPPTGFGSRMAGASGSVEPLGSHSVTTVNADTSSMILQMRLTRGAFIGPIWNNGSAAANSRGLIFPFFLPDLLPGDVLEARTAVAPAVAGRVVLTGSVTFMPLI